MRNKTSLIVGSYLLRISKVHRGDAATQLYKVLDASGNYMFIREWSRSKDKEHLALPLFLDISEVYKPLGFDVNEEDVFHFWQVHETWDSAKSEIDHQQSLT